MPLPPISESELSAPPEPDRPLRFMEIVRRRLRECHYSRRTEQAYVYWIRRFIRFHARRHPKDMGEREVEGFLSSLAVDAKVSMSTQMQAQSALVFLYDRVLMRPLGRLRDLAGGSRPTSVPTVLSPREMRALLRELAPGPRLCAELTYGSGLRVSECTALRVKDVDLDRLTITVRGGKGAKDRFTPLGRRCVRTRCASICVVRTRFS